MYVYNFILVVVMREVNAIGPLCSSQATQTMVTVTPSTSPRMINSRPSELVCIHLKIGDIAVSCAIILYDNPHTKIGCVKFYTMAANF